MLLVERQWKVRTAPDPRIRHDRIPIAPKSGDSVAWVMRAVRKVGLLPETFTYRPPGQNAATVCDPLDCVCRGKVHPVCLPAGKWHAWAKSVHAFLDRG